MRLFAAVLGLVLTGIVLLDAFETIVLPRRVSRKMRLTRYFYRYTWRPWLAVGALIKNSKKRDAYLSIYGPLSLILLLMVWAGGLIVSFALLHVAAAPTAMDGSASGFADKLNRSGNAFFTLGPGDGPPPSEWAEALIVIEAGTGLGFLAIVIGYLPVIYNSFSRREVSISLLDARAGSPPTAAELLRRHSYDHGMTALQALLRDWEQWSADLLESHLSYPVLAYFRSQHSNQSWLAALTVILDAGALVLSGVDGACQRQAELTFAIARHAVVDLSQVFGTPPGLGVERLTPGGEERLRLHLADAGLKLAGGAEARARLRQLRGMYEPYVDSLSRYLALPLPAWSPGPGRKDNWQTSAWENLTDEPSPPVLRPGADQ